jgi:hypothetical protein
MEASPLPPRPQYTWPKYVLAALALFLLVCVVWTWKEVRRQQRIKRESRDAPLPTLQIQTNRVGTNTIR